MRAQSRTTQKGHLLGDDGELRLGLLSEGNVSPLEGSFGEPKKNKAKRRQAAFRNSLFWLICIVYPLTFTVLGVLSQLFGSPTRDIAPLAIIFIAFVGGVVGAVIYWRFHRHVALGVLGGLIGLFVIVPISFVAIVVLLGYLANLSPFP